MILSAWSKIKLLFVWSVASHPIKPPTSPPPQPPNPPADKISLAKKMIWRFLFSPIFDLISSFKKPLFLLAAISNRFFLWMALYNFLTFWETTKIRKCIVQHVKKDLFRRDLKYTRLGQFGHLNYLLVRWNSKTFKNS